MARFLSDVPATWLVATPEQRNKLALCLFDQVWLKDKNVIAVKPIPELEPFFRLNYEDLCKQNMEGLSSTRPHLHHNNILSNLIRAYFEVKWYSCIVLTP
jgi:hypothetical protein